jgi:energy-converting hydrogenase Eha subunit H
MELGNLADRLPFYTKNIGKITATDIYFALDASFKITDLTIIKTNPLPGTMSGPNYIT